MALKVKINPDKIPDRTQALSIYKLSAKRKSREVLHEISFELRHGEILGIVGKSGSGKSTLCGALAGISDMTPQAIQYHDALLHSNEFMTKTPQERYRNGLRYVFEDRRLFLDLSVKENLTVVMPFSQRKNIHRRINDIIELFPSIRDLLERKANTLTVGQQQIVAIIRSIMVFPLVLIIDEPTRGLDPIEIEAIQQVISAISTGSVSIMIVEQNADFISKVATRTLVLTDGRLSEPVTISARSNEWKPK